MRRLAVSLGALALALAGCGSDADPTGPEPSGSGFGEPEPTATATETATATASPEATATGDELAPPPSETTKADQVARIGTAKGSSLGFTETTVTVDPGKLTFEMVNSGSIQHAVGIKGKGVNVQGALVGPGEVSRVEIALKPGRYRFYCPVPGHADGGMTGTLVVR